MQVRIKEFNVNMDVGSSGIEFEVRGADGSQQLGDCVLTMSKLIWCSGKTTRAKGVTITWDNFMAIMSSKETVAAAVKAAKQS